MQLFTILKPYLLEFIWDRELNHSSHVAGFKISPQFVISEWKQFRKQAAQGTGRVLHWVNTFFHRVVRPIPFQSKVQNSWQKRLEISLLMSLNFRRQKYWSCLWPADSYWLLANDVQKKSFISLFVLARCNSSKRSTYFSWISCHWWFRSWKSPKRLHGSAGMSSLQCLMTWCAFYINRFSFAYPSFSHNEFSLCRLWKNR